MRFGSREVLFLVIMIGLLLGAWYFVFMKANERIAMLRTDTREKQVQLEKLAKTRQDIRNIDQAMGELKTGIALFERKLPPERDVQTTLKQISAMASKNQLTVKQVRTTKAEKAAGYMEQQMSLVVTGDFSRFYQFQLALEKLDRITRVGQLRLEKTEDVEGGVMANMSLSIFFVPELAN